MPLTTTFNRTGVDSVISWRLVEVAEVVLNLQSCSVLGDGFGEVAGRCLKTTEVRRYREVSTSFSDFSLISVVRLKAHQLV